MYCVKTMACGVVILCVKKIVCEVAINSLKITLILQPARNEVNIGPVRVHGNRL